MGAEAKQHTHWDLLKIAQSMRKTDKQVGIERVGRLVSRKRSELGGEILIINSQRRTSYVRAIEIKSGMHIHA